LLHGSKLRAIMDDADFIYDFVICSSGVPRTSALHAQISGMARFSDKTELGDRLAAEKIGGRPTDCRRTPLVCASQPVSRVLDGLRINPQA
jgi:hypothetical protein